MHGARECVYACACARVCDYALCYYACSGAARACARAHVVVGVRARARIVLVLVHIVTPHILSVGFLFLADTASENNQNPSHPR